MQRNRIILLALLVNISIVNSGIAAATNGIASGNIFGIQIGQTLEMSPEEIKQASRTDGSFVRKKADKPSDIQFLQIYVTPITHVVTGVDGASEVRTKQQADAFVSKYTDVLSGLSNSFVRRKDATDGEVDLMAKEWYISIKSVDMRTYGRPPGYHVRISMTAYAENADKIRTLEYAEKKQRDDARRKQSIDKARVNGELKGLK